MSTKKLTLSAYHPYHLVNENPWPLITAISLFNTLICVIGRLHIEKTGMAPGFYNMQLLGYLILLIFCLSSWWTDVVQESTYQGLHTLKVQHGLKYGMVLFIASEVMFFFTFFWSYFHANLNPNIYIGLNWPPMGIEAVDAFGIPLLNTVLLLSSGVTVTWAHHAILANNKKQAATGLFLTVLLGAVFFAFQLVEYTKAGFKISDSVFGSVFYMTTGFHGFHVVVGFLFLTVCLIRLNKNHFSFKHHLGLEFAIWYWHFVDVVWLFLYTFYYYLTCK